jgi:hypothetical protein
MASTGSVSWVKYFKGNDVETVMKKESQAFDAEEQSKKLPFKVLANEKVLVYDANQYNSKILIKRISDGTICRVTFDNIQKPGRKTSVAFKPQTFGIGETKYNIENYVDLVLTNIEERNDIIPEVKNYLQALMLYFAGFEDINFVTNAYIPTLPFNDIKKDYGEVIGPVAIIKKGLLKDKGISIPSDNRTAKIYVPSRPNEPLMDYGIIVRNETFVISAKSGTTTNVVKPQDIINLLEKDPKKVRKHQNTEQYKVLKSLAENGIVDGIILAASKMAGGPSENAANDVKIKMKSGSYGDYKYDMSLFAPFINQNTYLKTKKKPTLNEIMYECEKIVANASKTRLNFTDIFKDAVENQVIYVKFDIVGKTPKFEVIMNDDLKAMRVTLRSKNGYTRRSDRIGIQV